MKRYKKTRKAAKILDLSKSFLTKGKDVHFFFGVHYFTPKGTKLLRWDMEAMDLWMRTIDMEELDASISKMLA